MGPGTLGNDWVVRGGEAKAPDLISGYGPHPQVPGLYGFSVQYAPGKTIAELAQAGHFRNATISYETAATLAQVVQSVGYEMRLIPSPGGGHHHTFAVLYDVSKIIQTDLPSVVAQALAIAFRRIPNPHRASPRPRKL